ncbi:conserved exported protein of unknown function [Bradyrhizobium sp. ORS 285]|uniref:DUF2946 family protein n=1 Tax=Bradyrhizobium sp. ORS 285 TaxID=115808 RepID=UPI0002409A2E|nr:DUF2946 family protein [Bradyrhizobium sp. ORS 285]CCD85786.1 conserved exported hypothetical protein [Bradyrhizobium sp. ORS 285]SMX58222.1 conserved exported protein of unknown function [Bradyrhizobium sp. ORS 285]
MTARRAMAAKVRKGACRAHGIARRRWIARILPLALLALMIQVLAPVAASAMTAATIATVDLLGEAVICHAEADAPPSDRGGDRSDCGLDCVMCCVLHAAGALDAPTVPTHAGPPRESARVAWAGREFVLLHLLAISQAQPRGPPFLS